MRRILIGLILFIVILGGHASFGQEAKNQAEGARPSWKMDFTVSEMEGGKVINERKYSLLILGQGRETIRAGNQVPIVTTVNNTVTTHYLDVALSIECEVKETSGGVTPARVVFEVASLAGDQTANAGNPVFRFVKGCSTFALNPGKRDVVLTADDVNTKRQYQIALLATRLN